MIQKIDMNKPFISVIMPIYCGQKYLSQAFDSLINQKEFNKTFEVIAAVDDDLEETQQILKQYSSLLPLKIIEGAKKKNWVATTNKAIRESNGEWICFLHQDDLFYPNKFSILEKMSSENPDLSLMVHPITYIAPNNKILGKYFLPFPYKPRLETKDVLNRLICQNIIMVPGVAFKRDVVDNIGYLDENLRYTADWEFWLRCVRSNSIIYYNYPLASFRVHKESQTVQFAEKQIEYHDNLKEVVNRNIPILSECYSEKQCDKIIKMAYFGVEFNCYLSNVGVGKRASLKKLVKDIFKCGVLNFVSYLGWAKVFERIFPRLVVLMKG